jgi:hypothetical protein
MTFRHLRNALRQEASRRPARATQSVLRSGCLLRSPQKFIRHVRRRGGRGAFNNFSVCA